MFFSDSLILLMYFLDWAYVTAFTIVLEIIYMLAWEERQTQLHRTGNLALKIKKGVETGGVAG